MSGHLRWVEGPWDLREPTADEIAGYLRERPDLAAQVIARARPIPLTLDEDLQVVTALLGFGWTDGVVLQADLAALKWSRGRGQRALRAASDRGLVEREATSNHPLYRKYKYRLPGGAP